MSLFYQIVFFVLVAEMAFFTLLIAPLPLSVRRPMLLWMSKSPLVTKLKQYLKIVFVYVFIMFIDSLNRAFKRQAESAEQVHHVGVNMGSTDAYTRARLFYDQRNLYLTGAVLFLSMVLNRFLAMVTELMVNESKTDKLKQQAASQSTEYMRLLDKDQDRTKEITTLKKEVEELLGKAREVDIIKKQAKQTHDEYMRLTDRYVELERKAGGGSDDRRKDK
ncbi:B-cell receptor-associated protein 31-like-domain-containing protein [Fimicolochytrium jonesii]|uniref:B-cell receptor-associated protein 31-like-domain-containing protein n=1 Tax=Fimicolochytrium jonesii TaxID=1396493 RepID=UPI0022FEF3FC|nr:B-cell receptor-associated protein 31-like-domain-containing protein [Fimicolochytrium jonesii]KAI8827065.1 B-cell receptor-associated protein 31-like-domain-containing protein [Fimicolochytrium jonesii]